MGTEYRFVISWATRKDLWKTDNWVSLGYKRNNLWGSLDNMVGGVRQPGLRGQ